ncbi:nitrate reductase subunit beta, partial [Streptomyces sp. GC420]|nr:nitrate reductase subunit beta [Streptomyces sp. GC420]
FQALRDRQTSDTAAAPTGKATRVNLLNWDGKGRPPGLFPPGEEGQGPGPDEEKGTGP